MDKRLHIVSFDVPYPADYGGAIDVFYKFKALFELGWKITLHCFDYGRGQQKELEKYCEKVEYYTRKTGIISQLSMLPYIVKSRQNKKLLFNLQKDKSPILFEGLHTCAYLNSKGLSGRRKLVRMHNIEQDYYKNLAENEKSFLKKLYYSIEAKKLGKFENRIKNADTILAISDADYTALKSKYNQTELLNAFHPNTNIESLEGKGEFALYHANLSVAENKMAAHYIIDKIAPYCDIKFIIAGKNPDESLIHSVNCCSNIELINTPSNEEMDELIQYAHIHFLPVFQRTGIKLKLLKSLFSGRYVIANSEMLHGTSLQEACIVADTEIDQIKTINNLSEKAFDVKEIEKRQSVLENYKVTHTAKALSQILS